MNWEVFFGDYRAILFEFLLELYVFYLIFNKGLKKKSRFWLRFIIGFACVIAMSVGVMFFYYKFGDTIWGRVITYLYLFSVSVFHLLMCYEEPLFVVLFRATAAYAAQNLAYKVFLIVWYAGEWAGFFPELFQTYYASIFYYMYYYSFFAVEAVIIYFLFARKIKEYVNAEELKYVVLVIAFVVLLITIVLCTIEDIYTHELSMILRQTSNVFSVTCCVCVLLLLTGIQEAKNLKGEIALLQHTIKQKEEQYRLSKETIDLINIKCHDMRHRLGELRKGSLTDGETQEMQEIISIYDSNIRTGNGALDVVLTEKNLYCEKMHINFSCMVDGKLLSFMSDSEIYCLFGNIIENAIEAVSVLEEKDKRTINLVVKSRENMLIIQQENYFEGEIKFENDLPVTSKKDKNYHGFGMKSIELIAHKYGGEMTCRAEDNIFHLNILFFGNDEQNSTN